MNCYGATRQRLALQSDRPTVQPACRIVYLSVTLLTILQDSAFLPPSGFRFRMTQLDAITSLNIKYKLVFVIGTQRVFREVETF